MDGESGVTQTIIDELHSWDIERDQWKVKVVLLEVSLMNIILQISNEIKWKLQVVLPEVFMINFFFGYPTRSSGRGKWCYLKYY